MSASAIRRATYQDVLDAPPNMIAEVIFGALHTQPRPAFAHTRTQWRLGKVLSGHFDIDDEGPAGWFFANEPELHLGHEPDILVPDIAGWRPANVDAGMKQNAPWTAVPPDWVCEMLSPSTETRDRGAKLQIYLRERVGHVWLIDPIEETLEIYRHGGSQWVRLPQYRGHTAVRAEPFEAIELDLGRLWGRRATPQP